MAKPLGELGKFRNSTQDRAYPVRVVVRSGLQLLPRDQHPHGLLPRDARAAPGHRPGRSPCTRLRYTPTAARPDLVNSNSLERSVGADGSAGSSMRWRPTPSCLSPWRPAACCSACCRTWPTATSVRAPMAPTTFPARTRGPRRPSIPWPASKAWRPGPIPRIITTTYSPASLPAFSRFGLEELAATQLTEGRNVLLAEPVGLLRSQPLDGWLLPTFGDLDQPSLVQLHRTNFNRLIISSRSLSPSDDPFTRALPVKLEGGPGSATEGLTGVEDSRPGRRRRAGERDRPHRGARDHRGPAAVRGRNRDHSPGDPRPVPGGCGHRSPGLGGPREARHPACSTPSPPARG